MAEKDDFCGDRLRLTAFLRIAEKMPRRPARFRRRLVEIEHNQAMERSSPQLNAWADHSPRTSNIPDHQSPSTEATEGSILNTYRHASIASGPSTSLEEMDIPSTRVPSHISGPPRTSLDIRDLSAERPPGSRHVRTPVRKRPVVYSAKTMKAPGSPRGVPSAWQEKRLSVKGLALVRTLTEDGLPSPGDAEVAPATPITDTDPIEDSLAVLRPNATKELSGYVRSQRKGISTGAGHGREALLGPYRMPNIARSNASLRVRRSKKLGVEALADGFQGLEVSLPPKTPKASSERHRNVTRTEKKVLPMSRQLQLAGGLLPESLPQPSIAMHSSMSNLGVHASQLQLALGSLPTVSAPTILLPYKVFQPTVFATESPGTTAERRSHADHSITTQFSRVTAPAREESDSDSESSGTNQDLGEDPNHYGANDESEGTDTSSASSGFESRPVASYHAREDSSYFGEALIHLNTTENEFWSQYGGTD